MTAFLTIALLIPGTDLWPLAVAYLVGILTGVAGLALLLTAVR